MHKFRTTSCAASQHALSGIRQGHSPATRQRCLSSLQRGSTLAGHQTRLRRCLHSRPFDMSSLVVPLLEQATVVPSEPQARSLSRNSESQSFTTLFNRSTDIRIVQKHDNIARGVISVESLCLRLGLRTVTRALHAQPDRCVRGTTRSFAHHLIRHFDCGRGQHSLG